MYNRYSQIPFLRRFSIHCFLVGVWIIFSAFGCGLGHGLAKSKLETGVHERLVLSQRVGVFTFNQKREEKTVSFSDDLKTLDLSRPLSRSRYETEIVGVPSYHSPDENYALWARPVQYQPLAAFSFSQVALYFDRDRRELGQELAHSIEHTVQDRATPTMPLFVEAYCDRRGGVEYSLALGHRRLQLVKQYLLDLGISHWVINSVNYGSSWPRCGRSQIDCPRNVLRIQSTFQFFAITQPQLGCMVRLRLPRPTTSIRNTWDSKNGPTPLSFLPAHLGVAPLSERPF